MTLDGRIVGRLVFRNDLAGAIGDVNWVGGIPPTATLNGASVPNLQTSTSPSLGMLSPESPTFTAVVSVSMEALVPGGEARVAGSASARHGQRERCAGGDKRAKLQVQTEMASKEKGKGRRQS